VASFDPAVFVAHSSPAPAVDRVGLVVELGIPEDIEGRMETFSGWPANLPAIERALSKSLEHLGGASWSATSESATRNGSQQAVLARSVSELPSKPALDLITRQVQDSTRPAVSPVSGTLSPRVEISFTQQSETNMSAADEAAEGYLHARAFEHHIERHGLAAVRRTA
jgi:hypothetical protein